MQRLSHFPPEIFRNECFKINLELFSLLDAVTHYVDNVLRMTICISYVLCQLSSKPADQQHVNSVRNVNFHFSSNYPYSFLVCTLRCPMNDEETDSQYDLRTLTSPFLDFAR